MSKKKKHTRGNPAKQPIKVVYADKAPLKRRCAYCARSTRIQPEQVSSGPNSRLYHHPVPNQEFDPMCVEERKMRGILHRMRQEAMKGQP